MRFINKIYKITLLIIVFYTVSATGQTANNDLDLAYNYLKNGKKEQAIYLFEQHIKKNPGDTKIYLQLAYEYSGINNDKAIEYAEYVEKNSKDPEEIKNAGKQKEYIKANIDASKTNFVDLYSYSIYDTYQENIISNNIIKYNNKIIKNLYAGIYADIYTDSKSSKSIIYNDRYVEGGAFVRYSFLPSLSFEVRAGYVREIDFEKSSFNFKPILSFSDRFGTDTKKTNYFLDVYSAALYDHKFENFFGQVTLRQVLAFNVNKSSGFETYLKESLLGDTKQFDYNNYAELGAGVAYVFKSVYLPTIFIEATNKFYFESSRPDSFQFKAGLLFNFYKFIW